MNDEAQMVSINSIPNQDELMSPFRVKYLELVNLIISNVPKTKQSENAVNRLQESMFWLESAAAYNLVKKETPKSEQ